MAAYSYPCDWKSGFIMDPVKKQRFEDGLNRISARAAQKPAGTGKAEPAVEAVYVALLLTALDQVQPPPQPPMDQTAAPGEAGSMFWKAVKQAKEQQYAEAIKALDQAAEDRKSVV